MSIFRHLLGKHESPISQRENHYIRYFGPLTEKVMHSTDAKAVHVDIYTFPPTEDRPFFVLLTGGMSDRRQSVPSDWKISPRAEIMMYVQKPSGWMYNVLKGLAEMPFTDGTFLSYRHTVPNGKPMTATESLLTSFFFVNPIFAPEGFSPMKIERDDTDILLLIPITELERQYAKAKGSEALISRFAEREFDPVVDETRESVVSITDLE